jgi:hypothetical protein
MLWHILEGVVGITVVAFAIAAIAEWRSPHDSELWIDL